MESIKRRLAGLANNKDANDLRILLDAILADITAVKSAVDVMATKLNNDAGVTDTNYAGSASLTVES